MEEEVQNTNEETIKIPERKYTDKSKEEIISDLTDLKQLYSAQGKELVETRNKLRSAEADVLIKNNFLEEKNATISQLNGVIHRLTIEIEFFDKLIKKLDEVIDKLIIKKA